jgi:upstream activation factor subunit UAF30
MEAPAPAQAEPVAAPKPEQQEEQEQAPPAEQAPPSAAAPAAPEVKPDTEDVKPPAVVSDEQIVERLRALLATADMATTTGESSVFCGRGRVCSPLPSRVACARARVRQSGTPPLLLFSSASPLGRARGRGRMTRAPNADFFFFRAPTLTPPIRRRSQTPPPLLNTKTEKMLRKSLEEQLDCELSHKKALIREEVQAYINAQQPGEEDAMEEEEEEDGGAGGSGEGAAGGGGGSGRRQPSCTLSPELQAFLGGGVETMPRTQVVKAIWDYIKAHDLQDPACRRNILPDAKLGTILTAPVTMFSMNKQLSKHVKTIPGSGGGGGGGGGASRLRARAPATRRRGSAGGGGGKARGGFAVPCKLSPEMAEVVGRDTMTRSDLTKWFWNYFRTKDLMDPDNKRYVVADDRLKKLFGEDRFLAFGIQRLVSKHVIKGEAGGGGGAAAGGGSSEEAEEEEQMEEEEGGGGVKEEDEAAAAAEAAVKEEVAAAAAAE